MLKYSYHHASWLFKPSLDCGSNNSSIKAQTSFNVWKPQPTAVDKYVTNITEVVKSARKLLC